MPKGDAELGEPLLKELHKKGRIGVRLPEPDGPTKPLAALLGRETLEANGDDNYPTSKSQ